ncbi:SEC-C metal-binding domain-containing protein [Geobacillus thermodenitrificans]|uniref:SEC-C metal-binding domain-containing protein n=1 Tax=Geobacillus thermodenitrificans TaxID=33940 RepID=UPI00399CD313
MLEERKRPFPLQVGSGFLQQRFGDCGLQHISPSFPSIVHHGFPKKAPVFRSFFISTYYSMADCTVAMFVWRGIYSCFSLCYDTMNITARPNRRKVGDDMTVSRNALCPCGSGKKYKHCCGKQEAVSIASIY